MIEEEVHYNQFPRSFPSLHSISPQPPLLMSQHHMSYNSSPLPTMPLIFPELFCIWNSKSFKISPYEISFFRSVFQFAVFPFAVQFHFPTCWLESSHILKLASLGNIDVIQIPIGNMHNASLIYYFH